jgi:hypothetical protein
MCGYNYIFFGKISNYLLEKSFVSNISTILGIFNFFFLVPNKNF